MVVGMGNSRSVEIGVEATGTRQASRDIEGVEKSLGGLKTGALAAGAALVTMGALGAGAISKFVGQSREFETAMAEINTLSSEGVIVTDEFRASMENLSREFGIAGGQGTVMSAAYQSISANIPIEETDEFLGEIAKLSTVGFTPFNEQVNQSATLLNVWGKETSEVADVGDLLFRVVQTTQTELGPFNQALNRVSPASRAAGLSLEETAGTLAFLTDNIGNSKEAGTAMRAMLTSLRKPTAEAASVIEGMGFASFDAAVEQLGFAEATRLFIGTAEDMNVPLQDAIGSVEGLAAAEIIAADESGKLEGKMAALEDRAGTVDEGFATVAETTDFQLRQAMNGLEVATTQLGDALLVALLPALNFLVDILGRVVDWFTGLPKPIQNTIAVVFVAATAFALVAGSVLILIGVLAPLVAAASGVVSALAAVGAIALKLAPIILALVAVAAVLFAAWQTNFLGIRDIVRDALDQVTAFARTAMATLQGLFAPALAAIENMWALHGAELLAEVQLTFDAILGYIETIMGIVGPVIQAQLDVLLAIWDEWGDEILGIVTVAFDLLAVVVETTLDAVLTAVRIGLALIRGDWEGAWDLLVEFVGRAMDRIVEAGQKGLADLGGHLKTGFAGLIDVIKAAWDDFVAWFFGLFDRILAFFGWLDDFKNHILGGFEDLIAGAKAIFEGLLADITAVFADILASVTDAVAGIKDTVLSGFEDARTTAETAVEGIRSAVETGFAAARTTAETAVEGIRSAVQTGFDAARSTAETAIAGIKSTVETGFASARSAVESAMSSIKSTVSSGFAAAKSTASSAITSIKQAVQSGFHSMAGTVSSAITRIKGHIVSGFNAAKSSASSAVTGIKQAVQSNMNSMAGAVQSALRRIKGLIISGFNSAKSSAVSAMRSMASTIRSIISGLASKISGLLSKLSSAKRKVSSGISGMQSRVDSAVSTATSTTTSVISSTLDFFGFQHGGVVTRPTAAIIGEGTEDEAVLPLSSLAGMMGMVAREARGGAARPIAEEIHVHADSRRGGREAGRAFLNELRSGGLRPP